MKNFLETYKDCLNTYTLLLIATLIILLATPVFSQEIEVKHYPPNEHSSMREILFMQQDKMGFMWFLTPEGLIKYDGLYWDYIPVPNSSEKYFQRGFEFDSNNTLWFYGGSYNVYKWQDNQWIKFVSSDSVRFAKYSVTASISCDDHIQICAIQSGKPVLFDGRNWMSLENRNNQKTYSLVTTVNNSFVLYDGSALYEVKEGRIEDDPLYSNFLPENILALYFDTSQGMNRLWYISSEEIGYLTEDHNKVIAPLGIHSDPIKKSYNLKIISDGYDGAIIATRYNVFFYDQKRIISVDDHSGFHTNGANNLLLDKENNVWIGTQRGLKRIISFDFLSYRKHNGLLQNEASALEQMPDGTIVCGHTRGLSIIKDRKIIIKEFPKSFTEKRNTRVMDILPDIRNKNAFWFSTDIEGLSHFSDDGEIKTINLPAGLKSFSAIQYDDNHDILLGTNQGVLKYGMSSKSYEFLPVAKNCYIRNFYYDNTGNLYVTTVANGIFIYNNKEQLNIKSDENVDINSTYSVIEFEDNILVGTKAGLYRLERGNLVKHYLLDKHITEEIYLFIVKKDELWIGCENGIYHYSKNDLVKYTSYTGLSGSETNRKAGLVDQNGDVWIGTSGGISCYKGSLKPEKKLDIKPILKFISAGDIELDLLHDIVIPYKNNNIYFKISYPSYKQEDNVVFEYNLTSVNSNEISSFITDSREIHFPNLSPRKYNLGIRIKDGTGEWSKKHTLGSFVIQKPFTDSIWFHLLVYGSGVFLILLFFYGYSKRKKIHTLSNEVINAHERMESIFMTTNLILLQIDTGGKLTYYSPGSRERTGINIDNLKKASIKELFHPDDQKIFKRLMLKLYERSIIEREIISARIKIRDKYLWYHFNITPVMNEGRTEYINVIVQDIDDFMLLEEKLRHSQKLEAIGQLAGSVAHDFNNLLTAIQGFTDLALNEKNSVKKIHSFLSEVDINVERASNLTKKLLAFSRKQKIQLSFLDMNNVILGLERMLTGLLGEVKLEFKLSDHLGKVKADLGQLEQIIMNLVVNARDAVNSDGKIIISTKSVVVPSDDNGHRKWVRVTVADNGNGIPENVKDKLFDPFFTTKPEGKGTGLGLSTVYDIVKQSKGHLSFDSELNKGTSFHVDLPVFDSIEVLQDVAKKEMLKSVENESILVIEDEKAIIEYIRRILSEKGYKVEIQSTGQKLFEDPTRYMKFDLIITDIVLPGINSMDYIKKLRKTSVSDNIIFMSGYEEEILLEKGINVEEFIFLRKPFKSHELLTLIRNTLDR